MVHRSQETAFVPFCADMCHAEAMPRARQSPNVLFFFFLFFGPEALRAAWFAHIIVRGRSVCACAHAVALINPDQGAGRRMCSLPTGCAAESALAVSWRRRVARIVQILARLVLVLVPAGGAAHGAGGGSRAAQHATHRARQRPRCEAAQRLPPPALSARGGGSCVIGFGGLST